MAVHDIPGPDRGGAAKDHEVDQRIRSQPVRPVNGSTPRLTHSHQARRHGVGVFLGRVQNFAPVVRGDASHIVVHSRQYGDRLLRDVDAGKHPRAFRNARQALGQRLGRQVVQVQMDMVTLGTHAAALADLHCHAAADHIARGEVLVGGRIAFHEPLAFRVGEVTALATRAFGDQATRTVDPGGMELHKLHVLKRQSLTCHHPATVAGAGMGGGRREKGPTIATRREYDHLGVEGMEGAVVEFPAQHALALAVIRHQQIKREVLDVELGFLLQALAVQRVQDRVARPVGGCTGALNRGAFPKLGGVAAERALVDLALFGARKWHAVVFEFIDCLGRLPGEVFHGIGIAEPIGALHRIVHMPLPMVGSHVGQRRRDAALGRDRMRPRRENLGNAGGAQALFGHAKRRPQPGATGTNHNHIIFMGLVFISSHGKSFRERCGRWRKHRRQRRCS